MVAMGEVTMDTLFWRNPPLPQRWEVEAVAVDEQKQDTATAVKNSSTCYEFMKSSISKLFARLSF